MVRCDHCGWSNNPDGAVKCQKCNQELVYQPSVPSVNNTPDVRRTTPVGCPKCGYPLSPDSSFCPNCGAAAAVSAANDPSMKKTMRDVSAASISDVQPEVDRRTLKVTPSDHSSSPDKASFRLRPIDLDAPAAFAFGADADAAFEFADGQWFVTDQSGTGSTYVCATRRIALMKGDVVLIGGRRYKFE